METKLQDYIKALKYGTGSGWEPSRVDIIELLEEIDKELTTEWVKEACDFKDELKRIKDRLEDISNDADRLADDIDDLID